MAAPALTGFHVLALKFFKYFENLDRSWSLFYNDEN